MRRMLAVGVVFAAGLVLTAPAVAAKPSPTEIRLQAEVSALQKQIPALQKQVKTLQKQVKELQNISNATIDYAICSTAVTADALQTTWATVNLSATGAIFGTETAVTDPGSCKAWKITRQPTGPANLTAFKALMSIFQSVG